MTENSKIMTLKTTKIILFAGIIAAMILPFNTIDFADAQEQTGRDIIKQDVSYKSMPTVEDVKEDLKEQGYLKEQIDEMDLKQKHYEKHQEWLIEHRDIQTEKIVREKQVILTEFMIEKFQTTNPTQPDYLPWTSIGYDYKDNALEITIYPEDFKIETIEEILNTVRSVVGYEIDVTISPMASQLEQVSCFSRERCSDLKAGVKITMQGKDFPCTLGFAATYNDESGFVTAGHCFDGLEVGTNAYHNGAHIGDLVRELATSSTSGNRCDCAFVVSADSYDVSDRTYGLSRSASTTGTSTDDKLIVASLSNSNTNRYGIIKDSSISYSPARDYPNSLPRIGDYYYKYAVLTDIDVIRGDSGSPVFGDNGRELLGFMVSQIGGDSIYVKHEKFTQYFRGLTWDF